MMALSHLIMSTIEIHYDRESSIPNEWSLEDEELCYWIPMICCG